MTESDRKNPRFAPERRRPVGGHPARRPRVAGSRRTETTVTTSPVDAAPASPVAPETVVPPVETKMSVEDKTVENKAVEDKAVDLAKTGIAESGIAGADERAGGDEPDLPVVPPVIVSRTKRGPIRRSIWALVAVAAVLVGLIVVAAIRPGVHTGNQAWVDSAATGEVLDAAKNGLATVLSYNYETIDQDQDNARGVLTGDMREQYDVTAQATKDFANQVKASATAIVDPTAITLLDGDRAEIVASVTVNAVIDGVDQGFVVTPVAAQLEQVDGQWLISQVLDR
ncbi:hypothetical protein [Millisia brevis]|uniref:hypothetical protein n=1 Tax=Millisia brevis TaxID=264148 RepID=UPI00082FB64E|nr:hypothetical protein [Millisia brevis]